MEPKHNDKNGCFPSFGNNFWTLFGLLVLDDEESKRREEKSIIKTQEGNESYSSNGLSDQIDVDDDV